MTLRPLLAALALLPSSIACVDLPLYEESCTLIGCAPEQGLHIELTPSVVGEYWIDLVSNGEGLSGGCAIIEVGAGTTQINSLGERPPPGGATRVADARFECISQGALIDGWAPASLDVTIEHDGDVRNTSFAEVEYDVSQPNGPRCEPTCTVARITVDVGVGATDGGP